MSISRFALTYDYRCPFARNAHEHVVAALRDGADWQVEFLPFSLSQAHVAEDGVPVWDDPGKSGDLLAIEASLVVRDRFPDRFLDLHEAMFAARHDEGRDVREPDVVRGVLSAHGIDADAVLAEVAEGWPREEFRKAHEASVADRQVFGVPTFVTDDQAVFVRLMTRPAGDAALARRTVDHVLLLLEEHPELNEYKHTSIPR